MCIFILLFILYIILNWYAREERNYILRASGLTAPVSKQSKQKTFFLEFKKERNVPLRKRSIRFRCQDCLQGMFPGEKARKVEKKMYVSVSSHTTAEP